MSATPALTEPANDAAQQREADTQYYRALLHDLAEMGADIARTIHRQVTTQPTAEQPAPTPASTPDLAAAFERIARAIRRTIALARTLDHPAAPVVARNAAPRSLAQMSDAELGAPTRAFVRHEAAREHLAREVEHAIEHEAKHPSEAALLRAELAEVLDDPGLDWEIVLRPIEDVIADICLDLGLDDIRDLRGRAARAAQLLPYEASSTCQATAAPPQTAPPWAAPTQTSTGPPAS